ncbi:hypothetical protein ABEB36_002056 [Hypothenemus hampei]|uniref:separase n=1 Tax=Hypothenemus hampei TaxID=57062 RepID=A0ABD1F4G0_HYPHA
MEDELETVEDILKELDTVSSRTHNSRSGLSHQSLQRFKASQTDADLIRISYLVDSHASNLREKVSMRFERLLNRGDCTPDEAHVKVLKDIVVNKCNFNTTSSMADIKKMIAELPKEWTIVQITNSYNPLEETNTTFNKHFTNDLYMTVFNCGQIELDPFCITINSPWLNGVKLELLQQLTDLLQEYKDRLTSLFNRKFFKNEAEKEKYAMSGEILESTLRGITENIEKYWLQHWRCLLIGKYKDSSIENMIIEEVNNIINLHLNSLNISNKIRQVLYYLTKGASFLTSNEILAAVQHCLEDLCNANTKKLLAQAIKKLNLQITSQELYPVRNPLILVIDECLDVIPWESLQILKHDPICRMPSLHFVYFLFKEYESSIENGYKVITDYNNGNYVVNPDGNLDLMEKRIMAFLKHWMPEWKGINSRMPTNTEFNDLLKSATIFSYHGHGNGTHIMAVDTLQKIKLHTVVLLFGCASNRIQRLGPEVETYGCYHMYLMSRCPCVLVIGSLQKRLFLGRT